jgi:hypothetical protein
MLASLIGAFISGEAMDAVRRAKTAAIIYMSAAILFLCGVGFLIGAGYIAAARRYGSLEAAIVFGVGFILIGGILLAIHAIVASARRRRKRRSIDLAPLAGAAALTALPLLLKRGGGMAAILAPLIGFAAYAVYRENHKAGPDDAGRRKE